MIHAFRDSVGYICEYPLDWDEGEETSWCLKRATEVGIGGKHYCHKHNALELEIFSNLTRGHA